MINPSHRPLWVLGASTFSFTVCFMVWMIFAVIGIQIKEGLGISETQFGLLVAAPILTGSLFRLPLGILTDFYGGRRVFFYLMIVSVIPVWLLSYATAYWQFLIAGLFIGVTGASFSVGITYCAEWFKKDRQGTAMGIFGAGNVGAALTKLIAPSILVAYGWAMVPKVYAILLTITAMIFWSFSWEKVEHKASSSFSLKEEIKVLRDPNVWKLCQFYSIVFGGYVALALWMTKYYMMEYSFDIKTAALLAACFSLPGGLLRAFGGYISDKYGAQIVTWWVLWVSMICFFVMAYPHTQITISTINGPMTFNINLSSTVFTVLIFIVGIVFALGKASVFKYIADDYTNNIGIVSGIVGLVGGIGGFLLPIMFGALIDITGIRSSIFILLWGITWVSLFWLYWSEIRPLKLQQHLLYKQNKEQLNKSTTPLKKYEK
jgi:NNP family nitrate/nitrite transporter-like MFS transporter